MFIPSKLTRHHLPLYLRRLACMSFLYGFWPHWNGIHISASTLSSRRWRPPSCVHSSICTLQMVSSLQFKVCQGQDRAQSWASLSQKGSIPVLLVHHRYQMHLRCQHQADSAAGQRHTGRWEHPRATPSPAGAPLQETYHAPATRRRPSWHQQIKIGEVDTGIATQAISAFLNPLRK